MKTGGWSHSPEPMMLPTMTVMPLRRLILASSLISPPPASPPAAAGFSSSSPLLDTDLRDTSVADMLAARTPATDWSVSCESSVRERQKARSLLCDDGDRCAPPVLSPWTRVLPPARGRRTHPRAPADGMGVATARGEHHSPHFCNCVGWG
jgi:hypothetical protein